ncbi:TetR/AcrR family transcriptional regulator C-terminal domain-containing protein [Microbacterium murale]|uniref:AcrR family transcriptional regulator n=1 Tax=Microbacterium murale TaxID=1081040 RepID=A0ABU0P4N9_9MICO|nr:TetR/AcrR family transcriptional regulator C-terminal domain-containing protein [Microbacterium murale]MDQ0642298.1 AcrR family transcriptional regulator [Microbacterium murale]
MVHDEAKPEWSRGIALAWGVAPPAQRGPKREFTLDQVIDAALAIADADDIDAVTMPSVAASLGLTAMSLYRYVGSKEILLLLLQERGMGTPPSSIADADGWRAGLEAHAAAAAEVYRLHPWMLDITIRGIATTPNNLAWLEAGLAALESTSLTRKERVAVVLQVSGHARFRALVERGYGERVTEAEAALSAVVRDEAELIRGLITDERFPELHATLATGALVDEDFDNFDFGLARILDGVAQYLAR